MGPEHWRKLDQLCHSALRLEESRRAAFIDSACAGDESLKREVCSLLSNARTDSFLDKPAVEVFNPIVEGSLIGRYRIVRLLGTGGMGAIYEAAQDQPRRTVALKIIRPGFATPETLRRFQDESQALGRLQHPGIAQIYEASTADTGFGPQPYFAMELIHGRPLHDYVRQHPLTTRDLLGLMVKICDASHHAHLRGVIHRDLKPGNILIDESGQPKIVDFGVARVTEGDAHDTHQTSLGQLVGTLAYMSPEQVAGDPLDLDARSDVYSLGVILYELLAGRLPCAVDRKPLHEAVKVICEQEPSPLGSVRRACRGDIETIAGKALEKDKARRYASAAEMAADLQHYLADRPIAARPAGAVYRMRKFVRRHKVLVGASAVVFLVMAAGVWASTREALRARNAERVAQAINDFLQNDLLAQASADNQSGPDTRPDPKLTVRTALDRAAATIKGRFDRQPEVEAAIRETIGQSYLDLGLLPEARVHLERALELDRQVHGPADERTLRVLSRLALAADLQGRFAQAEALYDQALETERRVLGPHHPVTLNTMSGLADIYRKQGQLARAEALESQTLETQRRVLGPLHRDTLDSMNSLALIYYWEGKFTAAEALDRQALEICRHLLGPEHPGTLEAMNNLAIAYQGQHKFPQAEALFREILETRQQVLGPEHPSTLNTHVEFAALYQRMGNYALAASHARQALLGYRSTLGPDEPQTIDAAALLAQSCLWDRKFIESEKVAREVLALDLRVRPDHWQRFAAEILIGASLAGQKRFAEAEPLLLGGYQGMLARKDKMAAATWHYFALARGLIVRFYQAWGKPKLAAEWNKPA